MRAFERDKNQYPFDLAPCRAVMLQSSPYTLVAIFASNEQMAHAHTHESRLRDKEPNGVEWSGVEWVEISKGTFQVNIEQVEMADSSRFQPHQM